jgi:hypothetical protein
VVSVLEDRQPIERGPHDERLSTAGGTRLWRRYYMIVPPGRSVTFFQMALWFFTMGESDNTTNRRTALKLMGMGAVFTGLGAQPTAASGSDGGPAFEFATLAGNTLTGGAGDIRDVPADGYPWVLEDGEASLESGTLELDVEGLVIDPDADHSQAGTNPLNKIRVAVSVLSVNDRETSGTVEWVETESYPVSEDGEASISASVDLPSPALAPIVFVTKLNGSWIAVGGQ